MRVWIGLVVGCAASVVCAQTEVGQSFEAASLKRAAANATPKIEGGPGTNDPERVRYSGLSLLLILQNAFGVKARQISGPAWMENETYDLEAKIPPAAASEEFRLMLQRLLAERIGLRFHRESHDLNGYELVVAKGGVKMQSATLPSDGAVLAPSVDAIADPKKRANMSLRTVIPLETGLKRITARLQTPLQIAQMCLGYVEGEGGVVDKTGLTGRYDFNLDFATSGARGPRVTPEQLAAMPTPDGPDFVTALREQLGLQLRPIKIPTDFVIIDHIERIPTKN